MSANIIPAIQIQGISAETLLGQIKEVVKELLPKSQPQVQNPTERLMTRHEVANFLGVSLVTLHSWTKANILTAYRIGNKVRYKESEVLNALQQMNNKTLRNE
ncbi:helix-turn-helix domain-containing protein [Capnocytophaga sp.]|uniref:helix-turn-helix domain-containing protein n=1 Tax=Capnocytophaga sp. TaxID=44737 RepID=UPI0026DD7F14|nr:helix-turn-helix domain-containing protein [Capnocytophaga sp.]MDO5106427.1 helix-turn-helix domain-containing protein [Capnocytophaga sp.]